jgi:hypothetical protein
MFRQVAFLSGYFFLLFLELLAGSTSLRRYPQSHGNHRKVSTNSGVSFTQPGLISKRRSKILHLRLTTSRKRQAVRV